MGTPTGDWYARGESFAVYLLAGDWWAVWLDADDRVLGGRRLIASEFRALKGYPPGSGLVALTYEPEAGMALATLTQSQALLRWPS